MVNPQLDNEVRGMDNLRHFGQLLFHGYTPEWQLKAEAAAANATTE